MTRFSSLLAVLLLLSVSFMAHAEGYPRGDVDRDGAVNISDVTCLIDNLLKGVPEGDVDQDGLVNISDVTSLIDYLLSGSWPDDPVTPSDEGDWVDLGLPSGTIWATRNIGASSPEDYGDYFAWGETEPKDFYYLYTYKWWESWTESGLTYWGYSKYCNGSDAYMGILDDRTELDPEDDAATVNWGADARTPSTEQIQELISSCTRQWTQRNDVNGMLVIGPNGNTIFLPAAGVRYLDMLQGAGSSSRYWSRTVGGPAGADYLSISSIGMYWNADERCYGYPVRAVLVPQN